MPVAYTETDILTEVVSPAEPGFSPELARALLELRFSEKATQRMRELLELNNRGMIARPEEAELDNWRRVGLLLDLMQAKARLSLKDAE